MCLDIKNFYLTAALDYYKYMKIPLTLFPEWIKKQYNLTTHARDGFVFLEIRRAVWGLPQAGILANTLLRMRLKPHGYYECVNTPGLWRHANRPIMWVKSMQSNQHAVSPWWPPLSTNLLKQHKILTKHNF